MNRHLTILVLFAAILLTGSSNAYAIGDSGGGCWGLSKTAVKVLSNGSAADLETEIKNNQKKNQSSLRKILGGQKNPISMYGGCGEEISTTELLMYAVRDGNMDTTRYLVNNGAKIEKVIFADCDRNKLETSTAMKDRDSNRWKTFSYLLDNSSFLNDKEIFQCKDPNLIRLYFKKGAKADVSAFRDVLEDALRASEYTESRERYVEKLSVFLSDGGLSKSKEITNILLKACAAPKKNNIMKCGLIERTTGLNFKELLSKSEIARSGLFRVCAAPYISHRFGENDENCEMMENIEGINFEKFKKGLQYEKFGDYQNYGKTFESILVDLNTAPQLDSYKSAVLFHRARATGHLCNANAERYLKEALEFEKLIKVSSEQELGKRYYELAYFYFDHGRFAEAIPYFESFDSKSKLWLDSINISYMRRDISIAYSQTGNLVKAKIYEKDADRLYKDSNIYKDSLTDIFERKKYSAQCVSGR